MIITEEVEITVYTSQFKTVQNGYYLSKVKINKYIHHQYSV